MQSECMQIEAAATLTVFSCSDLWGTVMWQKKSFSQSLEETNVPPQGSECSLFLFVSWAVIPGNAMPQKAATIEASS